MHSLDDQIIGNSKITEDLKKLIVMLSPSDAPILIHGPTGAGKDLVAQSIHNESRRKGNFVALNCAAVPKDLIEAEIFGFEKGAFTGAINTTKGKFEQSHNGTVFLDEIGDMPLELQSKLLRVLENAKISRVGGAREIKLNLRVICASHKDLLKLVEKGSFREDLYYRLNVLQIEVPELRRRVEDIPALVKHFIKKKSDGSNAPIFTEDAFNVLKKYDWPGNIRELRNVVERARIFFSKQEIQGDDVKDYLLRFNSDVIDRTSEQIAIWNAFDQLPKDENTSDQVKATNSPPVPSDFRKIFNTQNSLDLRRLLRDIEIELIVTALNRNNGNTSEAAKDLKLLRTTLIEKIKKYGI